MFLGILHRHLPPEGSSPTYIPGQKAPYPVNTYYGLPRSLTINDNYGNAGGDQVLKDFGCLIKKHCRREELSACFGGEEYIMALPQTDLPRAISCAEIIRALDIRSL
jgi:GGDEF domain-containing protein